MDQRSDQAEQTEQLQTEQDLVRTEPDPLISAVLYTALLIPVILVIAWFFYRFTSGRWADDTSGDE